jgi:hypothetical protein
MKTAVIAAALVLVSTFAMAQGHGGMGGSGGSGGMGGSVGNGGMGGSVGNGSMGGSEDFGRGGDEGLLFGADGTVYIVHSTSTTTTAAEMVAIGPSGVVVWRSVMTSGRGHLVLSGSNLINVTGNAATATTAATSTLTAMSAATGTQVWTLTLDGRVGELRPFSGGTYAVVVAPAATAGTAPSRTLVGISNSGTVLFKVAI